MAVREALSGDGITKGAKVVWLVIKYVLRRFGRDRGARVAASLSYTSLLSLVPMLTIAFALFSAFSDLKEIREDLRNLIIENLLPQAGVQIEEYFDQFIANAGSLTAIGVVALVVTALILFSTIETAMNNIFRVARPRPILTRVLIFWALLTLGPLLVGASFVLATYIVSLTQGADLEVFTGLGRVVRALPAALIMLALALLYFTVPHRPIRWKHAMLGGFVAGALFAGLRYGFTLYLILVPTFKAVYGAISTIPILLVWMYLSWAVVLLGAELTATLSEWRTGDGRLSRELSPRHRLYLAVKILGTLFADSREGGGGVKQRTLFRRMRAPSDTVDVLLERLRTAGYVELTASDRWVIARDLASVDLYDLCNTLDLKFREDNSAQVSEDAWAKRLDQILADLDKAQKERMRVPLRTLFARKAKKSQSGGSAG